MKSFESLTPTGQIRRLRVAARSAQDAFGRPNARLTFIHHGENTTFRLDGPNDNDPRCLLRLHRPGHQKPQAIASELMWLQALDQDTTLNAPLARRAPDGRTIIPIDAPGLEATRQCTLMRWSHGRRHRHSMTTNQARQLGTMMATLHQHASRWQPPEGFDRPVWDPHGLVEDFGQCWPHLSASQRLRFKTTSARFTKVFEALKAQTGGLMLLHADLHPGNVLYKAGKAIPIDFDDCGWSLRVYDVAVLMSELAHRKDRDALLDALLEGYAQVAPPPTEELQHLWLFVAARRMMITQWVANRALQHNGFARSIPRIIAWAMETLDTLEPV